MRTRCATGPSAAGCAQPVRWVPLPSTGGVEDLREQKVREFLRDVESELVHQADARSMYRALQIVQRVNSHEVPLNVGLLFFSEDAGKWFRGARIEVVHFGDDVGGDVLDERTFQGGIHEQLRSCLTSLQSFSTRHIEKGRGPHTPVVG